jgi:hypothetical protein
MSRRKQGGAPLPRRPAAPKLARASAAYLEADDDDDDEYDEPVLDAAAEVRAQTLTALVLIACLRARRLACRSCAAMPCCLRV